MSSLYFYFYHHCYKQNKTVKLQVDIKNANKLGKLQDKRSQTF